MLILFLKKKEFFFSMNAYGNRNLPLPIDLHISDRKSQIQKEKKLVFYFLNCLFGSFNWITHQSRKVHLLFTYPKKELKFKFKKT